jgi:hypothetical protein
MDYTIKGIDKKAFLNYLDILYEAKRIGFEEYGTLFNAASGLPDLSVVPETGLMAEMMQGMEKLEALAKREG